MRELNDAAVRLEASRIGRIAFLVCAMVASWLFATLWLVNIEFDDGYSTILNSQYFLGVTQDYYWQRGPFMAWLMVPAEFIAYIANLHPLDVRFHHLISNSLHVGYLVAVWRLLVSQYGCRWAVLVAYVAAVPTVLFFSYSPFVSHDIFPGLVLLWMIFRAETYLKNPTASGWWMLVLIGAAIALVKQTYAAFWVAVLVGQFVTISSLAQARTAWIAGWARLLGSASASAIIVWVGYAWALSSTFPDHSFFVRPWIQAQTVLEIYTAAEGPIAGMFYQWVYLKNISAYGLMASIVLVPGLWLCLKRGDFLSRTVAVSWLFLFALMLWIPFKEVRYLGFLSPLTAFIIVPAIDELIRSRKRLAWGLALPFAFDLGSAGKEAWRVTDDYYRAVVGDFLSELPSDAPDSTIYFFGRLSFIDQSHAAFFGDRYHRITHLIPEQVRDLYGYSPERVRIVNDLGALGLGDVVPGQILVFANDIAARIPPIRSDNATILMPQFTQFLAVAESVELLLEGEVYRMKEPSNVPLVLIPSIPSGPRPMTFDATGVAKVYGYDAPPETLIATGFRFRSLCKIDGCRRLLTDKITANSVTVQDETHP